MNTYLNGDGTTGTLAQLTDWSQRPEDGIKAYSGVATYRKSFSLPVGVRPDQPMFLDLGVVREMARVEINGRDLGVVGIPKHKIVRWNPEMIAMLGKVPDQRLAEPFGMSLFSVLAKRKELGIPPYRKLQWTPKVLARLGKVRDIVIAEEMGAGVSTVRTKRSELGIPLQISRPRR